MDAVDMALVASVEEELVFIDAEISRLTDRRRRFQSWLDMETETIPPPAGSDVGNDVPVTPPRQDRQITLVPSGAGVRDAEDEVYDLVDLTGCRNLYDRLVRIAETLRRPINLSRSARFLIRAGTSRQSVASLRVKSYDLIMPSPDFVGIGDGDYQYIPIGGDDMPGLLTVASSEDEKSSIEYG